MRSPFRLNAETVQRITDSPRLSMPARAAVILAAGIGTRLKSPIPKVLNKVGGRAVVDRVIDACEGLGCERIVVVVGDHSPQVRAHIVARLGEGAIAVQTEPLGTAHAALAAKEALADFDGDAVPLQSGSFKVDVIDEVPVLVSSASSGGNVDEGGLDRVSHFSSGTDLYGDGNDPHAAITASGSLSGLAAFGADGPSATAPYRFVSTTAAAAAGGALEAATASSKPPSRRSRCTPLMV